MHETLNSKCEGSSLSPPTRSIERHGSVQCREFESPIVITTREMDLFRIGERVFQYHAARVFAWDRSTSDQHSHKHHANSLRSQDTNIDPDMIGRTRDQTQNEKKDREVLERI